MKKIPFKIFNIFFVAIIFSAGCATPPEVKITGDLVAAYSQRLNQDLQNFENSFKSKRSDRAEQISIHEEKIKFNENFVNENQRIWAISKNKTAEHLFDSLKKNRPDPIDLQLSIPPASSNSEKAKKAKLYDPKHLETTIKKTLELIKEESFMDRADFLIKFVKEVRSKLKEKQKQAEEEIEKGTKDTKGKVTAALEKISNSESK